MMMTVLPEQRLAGLTAAASQLEDRGIPADLARNMAMLKPLLAACDICRLMTSSRLPLKEVACTYFAIGETLKIDVCREQSTSIRGAEHWDRLTLRRATAGFYSLQHRLTASAINHNSAQELPTETRLSAWLDTHKSDIKRALNVIDTLSHTGDWTVSKITVAESELRTLADAVDTNDARNREKV